MFLLSKKKTINKNERPKEGIKKGGGITHKWGDRVCVGARGVCADYRFIIIFFIIITAAVAIIIIFLFFFIFYHKIIRQRKKEKC